MESRNQRGILERQPALIRGGRALLFERLCSDTAPGRPAGPPRARELQDLADSVLKELRSLLNTRLPAAVGVSDESSQTVVNYGLPDYSLLNSASPGDRETLARLIERKIAGFEPRLRQVRVSLAPHPVERGVLLGTMHALLQTESFREPVSFPLEMGRSGITLTSSDYASR